MNILITGVAGLLGSKLADWVSENLKDVNVIGIDDLSGGFEENVNSRVKFYRLNCSDSKVESLFERCKFDYVFHFAAYAAEGLSPFIRTYNYENNLLSTANIVNNCINYNVRRLVFSSTMAVYGEGWNGKRPFDENDLPAPIDPYGIAKYACEQDIRVAGDQHGLDWCIIRPHNVYGEKQNIWDRYRNVLGIWMWQHLNNEPMSIFGDGSQTRAFSYIDDILEPLWLSAVLPQASKEIINLGGKTFYTIKEANDILKEVIGEGESINLEPRHEVKDAYPTWSKSEKILNFSESVDLTEGLTRMWNWVNSQEHRHRLEWPVYEVEKGIYKFWK